MALVSPGVEVQVIDESFYTPAAAGTVPMIFVATAENKSNGSGTGIAAGTLAANAGKPYLITSQRELVETFGDPVFYSDANGNMIHAGELNEYGLQTAYSLLGVTNRVYVTRADIDLSKLTASATAPGGEPDDGTYWLDTDSTAVGVQEWNGAAVTTTGGQTFTTQTVTILTEASDMTGTSSADAPKGSVGAAGDYALAAHTNVNKLWYKTTGYGWDQDTTRGDWVAVGSEEWKKSWATITGTDYSSSLQVGHSLIFTVEGTTHNIDVGYNGTALTIEGYAEAINEWTTYGTVIPMEAAVVDSRLEIYTTEDNISVAQGTGTLLADLGITAGTYYSPAVNIGPHTAVPAFKSTDTNPRPTGSLWLKTTTPNGGANFVVKQWNTATQLWETQAAPIYQTTAAALYGLDRAGGGINIDLGTLYVKANIREAFVDYASDSQAGTGANGETAEYLIYRRQVAGVTRITSGKAVGGWNTVGTDAMVFSISETRQSSQAISSPVQISLTLQSTSGSSVDADDIAAAINGSGLQKVTATVDAQARVVISHAEGGDFRIQDTSGHLAALGFTPFVTGQPNTTANLYSAPAGDTFHDWIASNWKALVYTAAADAPLALAPQGELWYNSVVDEVDIMIHNGNTWVGYQNYDSSYQLTNATGPIVAASEPTTQTDGVSSLVDGDLWVDTADIENYPMIYRYNGTLSEWVLLDKTDQTTENGVLFADARWSDSGADSAPADIDALLTSNYLDPDAPDPALYPKGMLLWNMRRSGFNVKRFERNYIDTAGDNIRYDATNSPSGLGVSQEETMNSYYPHRWVTDSGNNEDGSGTFGRHAQRKSVVQSLQAMVNSNQDIRDEESRQYNIIATPGYPELIGEMITLNYDRRLTAFVVGDTPARLTPDATSLNEWATNVRLAVEDNDNGAVSFDEYLGMYYPWGFTSDNEGNNVVVPPSHMALRTIVLNDQVAYPWFAPAGTRRGGVTNATATGYVDAEGEFNSVALNTGQRDTLYSNSINPITFISGSGLVVFGQKTRARNASALDRVNVARLIVYMRVQLERLTRPYLFEPNDKITRDQVKAAAEAFLLELVGLRALYDFIVVCDETNNTPARIDRNELWLDIAIEPVKAIEFIYIPLRIKNTGEIAQLG
jgi:phage tail sheath protein FI